MDMDVAGLGAALSCSLVPPIKVDTGESCPFLFQGIFLTQGWRPGLLHWHEESIAEPSREATEEIRNGENG